MEPYTAVCQRLLQVCPIRGLTEGLSTKNEQNFAAIVRRQLRQFHYSATTEKNTRQRGKHKRVYHHTLFLLNFVLTPHIVPTAHTTMLSFCHPQLFVKKIVLTALTISAAKNQYA
jgi:hypothetical protein